MNRRDFTLKSLLALVGVSILPTSSLFSKSNAFHLLDIGLPNEHVRHGLLNNIHFTSIPPLGLKIKRDIFFKNGIEKSIDNSDSYLITIKSKGKIISFFSSNNEVYKNGIKITKRMLQKDEKHLINYKKSFIFSINGNLNAEGIKIGSKQGIILNRPITISGKGEYIIIEKKF